MEKKMYIILEWNAWWLIVAGLVAAFGFGAWHQLALVGMLTPLWVGMHHDNYPMENPRNVLFRIINYFLDFLLIRVYVRGIRRFNLFNPLSYAYLICVGLVIHNYEFVVDIIDVFRDLKNLKP
jgi:hypothetical protein